MNTLDTKPKFPINVTQESLDLFDAAIYHYKCAKQFEEELENCRKAVKDLEAKLAIKEVER